MFKNILVPIDLTNEASARSLPQAINQAKASGGRIRLMSVQTQIPAPAEPYLPADYLHQAVRDAENRLKAMIAENNISDIANTIVRFGTVYQEVLDEAKTMGADLIIVVSHHPTISDYLLGSNASSIVRHAGCSVLVLRN